MYILDHFYIAENSNERISSYNFCFTQYIGEYVTTDKIDVYLGLSTDTLIIKFDKNEFKDQTNIDIDHVKTEEALEKYINDSINTDKYTLKSYNIKKQYLTYIENKLCLVYAVDLNMNTKNGSEVVVLTDIGIYLNE